MPHAFQVSPPMSLTQHDLLGLRGGGHALELKVVAHLHPWLDEAVSVLDADALVTEGHVGRHNHLHLRASLPLGNGIVIYAITIFQSAVRILMCHM